jgi:hypothetical protein
MLRKALVRKERPERPGYTLDLSGILGNKGVCYHPCCHLSFYMFNYIMHAKLHTRKVGWHTYGSGLRQPG